ncbi:type IV secretion system protein, partial [Bartonella quintana]
MAFKMFTQLFTKIDQVIATYVTGISSKIIATMTPFVSISLTIAFIVYGWLIMRGAIDMPVSGFLSRCLRISIITSIALTTGLYQKDLADLIIKMPDELVSALISNPPT